MFVSIMVFIVIQFVGTKYFMDDLQFQLFLLLIFLQPFFLSRNVLSSSNITFKLHLQIKLINVLFYVGIFPFL